MNIWFCDLTYDQQVIASDTIPTNIGYIASYTLSNSRYPHEVRLFKYPGTLISAIDSSNLPDVIGFSHFMWNARLSYALAERLRRIKKDIVIVFGGLNYPGEVSKQQLWFHRHRAVDFYVYKEGETAFLGLVESLTETGCNVEKVKEQDLPGVHCIRKDGSFHAPLPAPRVRDLAAFPSPYLTGLLDEFFDGRLMPLLTTNRGCPFTCTFCAEGVSYYNKINRFGQDRVAAEIEYIGRKIGVLPQEYSRRDLYISDSNFGMYKEDEDVARALQQSKEKYGWPYYVIATTGKNNKERVLDVARILHGEISVTGSVQSLDPKVLVNIKRKNIDADVLLQMSLSAASIGANSYSDIILGLPGDSLRAHESTLRQIINAKFTYANTWQLVMLADSEISTEENRQRYRLHSRFRVLARNYGNYAFKNGDELSIAEIEEVCVEGDELPFADYLQARLLHLIIRIFYNDQFFSGILKLIDYVGIERYAWVKEVVNHYQASPGLRRLFGEYLESTKQELWDSQEELERFVDSKEIIERYLSGELGANLLGKYRIMAITDHIGEVCEMARQAVRTCLAGRESVPAGVEEFLEELMVFEEECRRDIFVRDLDDSLADFSYDILKFLQDEQIQDLDAYRMPEKRRIRFYRTQDLREMIRRNETVFGTSIMARYKQMTRIAVKNLYRHATYVEPPVEGLTPAQMLTS